MDHCSVVSVLRQRLRGHSRVPAVTYESVAESYIRAIPRLRLWEY